MHTEVIHFKTAIIQHIRKLIYYNKLIRLNIL